MGIVALTLFAQLSSALHFAVETHEICAEHGDWVHADSEGHAAQAPLSDVEGADALSAKPAEEGHGHEHCTAVSSRELECPSHLTEAAAPPAVGAAATNAAPSLRVPALAGIYAYAPKTSPPVVALPPAS